MIIIKYNNIFFQWRYIITLQTLSLKKANCIFVFVHFIFVILQTVQSLTFQK